MKTIEITRIEDVLTLDEKEFDRFLPDFILWYRKSKAIRQEIMEFCKAKGIEVGTGMKITKTGLIWTDDGINELRGIKVECSLNKQEKNNE